MVDELAHTLLKNIHCILSVTVKTNNILKTHSRGRLDKLEQICGMKY